MAKMHKLLLLFGTIVFLVGIYLLLRARELEVKDVEFITELKDTYWDTRAAGFIDPDANEFIIVALKK